MNMPKGQQLLNEDMETTKTERGGGEGRLKKKKYNNRVRMVGMKETKKIQNAYLSP